MNENNGSVGLPSEDGAPSPTLAGVAATPSPVKKWRWLVKRLPRRIRIELLEALAYPEFEVTRFWLSPTGDGGVKVDNLPLGAVAAKEEENRLWMQLGAPVWSQAQWADHLKASQPR